MSRNSIILSEILRVTITRFTDRGEIIQCLCVCLTVIFGKLNSDEGHLNLRTVDNVYLFTVESYCGDGVGVLPILESVEDGCLSAAIQTNHHTMIASAGAETH